MIIAFEGIDKVGKNSQAKLLQENLKKQNVSSTILEFPSKNSPVSSIIREILKIESISNHGLALLFAADRYFQQNNIKKFSEQFDVVILDRYSDSGCCYAAASGIDLEWLKGLEKFLQVVPNLTFFFNISPQETVDRVSKLPDKFENNYEFLKRVFEEYKNLYKENGRKSRKVVFLENGSIEEIGQKILREVLNELD